METQLELPEMPPPTSQEEERRAVERVMGLEEGALEGEIVEETPEAAVAEAIAEERAEFASALPVQYDETAVAPVQPSGGTSLAFADILQLAELAEASGCFPGQNRIQLATKAMVGQALGLSPAVAFQQIISIRGNLSISAELQRTLVMKAGYRIRCLQSDSKICELELIVAGTGEIVGSCSFTLDEAKAAGLLRSDAWCKWPSDMLWARASTRLIARFAPWCLYFNSDTFTP